MPTCSANTIRILIMEEQAVMRAGLHLLIKSQPGMSIVGEARNRAEAVSLASREQPDIILLDLAGDNGLGLLRELLNLTARTRIIILADERDTAMLRCAISLGAMGLVLKDQASKILIKAIEKVHEGELWLDRLMTAKVLTAMSRSNVIRRDSPEATKIAELTRREKEIIALVGEGLRNQQIADRLFISEKTVRNHLMSIFSKLEVSDRLELAIYATRNGLTNLPPTVR